MLMLPLAQLATQGQSSQNSSLFCLTAITQNQTKSGEIRQNRTNSDKQLPLVDLFVSHSLPVSLADGFVVSLAVGFAVGLAFGGARGLSERNKRAGKLVAGEEINQSQRRNHNSL